MIFVTLGTQDKPFVRLLDILEHSSLTDEIIVQAGYTDYQSKKMKIYKYLDKDDFERYMEEADIVIAHAGVGTILSALNKHKKVLVVPRLAKLGEHTNDHQLQIAEAFSKQNYIMELLADDDFEEVFKRLMNFKPQEFNSNNSLFVSKLRDYLEL